MMFRKFEDEVREILDVALSMMGFPNLEFELLVPSKEGLGDLSTAAALKLARETKRPPAAIAEELRALMLGGNLPDLVSDVKAHPSGYLNFYLNWGEYA